MLKYLFIHVLLHSTVFIICVTCNMGKAFYFLQKPWFVGGPPDEGLGYEDPIKVKNAGALKVLFGHYSAFLENRNISQIPLSGMTKDPLFPTGFGKKPISRNRMRKNAKLSKVVELYRKNLFAAIKKAAELTSGSKSDIFQSQLESCEEDLKKCDAKGDSEIQCGVECLTKGNRLFRGLVAAITTLVDKFCMPINTAFDKLFDVQGPMHPNLRKFWSFLKCFRASKKTVANIATQGAKALVPMIIDNIKTEMMPFRLLNLKLETALQAEVILNPRTNTSTMIANDLCLNVDDADISEDLMDVLYRNPVLVEAALGGLTTYNLVSKYLVGRFRTNFAAAAEAIRIMTGCTCGLIQYSKSGTVPSCDQIGGFPVTGIPLPVIPDMPNLNQECLKGNALNSDKDEGKEAPSTGKSKREIKTFSLEKKTLAEKDGVGVDKRKDKVVDAKNSNNEKKRTLAVGGHRK